jgi:hypothetical protein
VNARGDAVDDVAHQLLMCGIAERPQQAYRNRFDAVFMDELVSDARHIIFIKRQDDSAAAVDALADTENPYPRN